MDDREIRRYELYAKLKNMKPCIDELQIKLSKMKYEYSQVKVAYELIDRELMLEKKTILSPTGLSVKRQKAPRQLTIDEVKDVADRLGIDISKLNVK